MRGKSIQQSSGSNGSKPRRAKRTLPVFVKRDFLTKRELRGLTKYVLAREPDFTQSSIIPETTNDPSYRKSRVLFHLGEYEALIQERLMSLLPDALKLFNRAPFELSHIDIQVTASNNNDFFKVHNDNGHDEPPEIPRREISFVHYFNSEPKAFTGGHLRFYDCDDGCIESSDDRRIRTIIPRQNTLVLFPSSYSHEVLPIKCPSGKFAHSRFTANGWFVRQDPAAQQAAAYGEPASNMSWLVDAVKALSEQLTLPTPTLYVTLEEASEFSGLSLEYLGQLIDSQQLKAIYDGGWKVRRADIEGL